MGYGLKIFRGKAYKEKVKLFVKVWYWKNFKRYIKVKHNDVKTFPIVIISYNQLFYLRKLVSVLQAMNYKNLVIIDNGSEYEPLKEFLHSIKKEVTVHFLDKNYGHKVFWKKKELVKIYGQDYYVITDADIVPDHRCPENFLEYFKEVLDKNTGITKVGFSLSLVDIPSSNPHREKIIKWEEKFWEDRDEEGNYLADIDTTFALYRGNNSVALESGFFKGIRTKPPYTAIHGGWHIDVKNLSPEQKNYMKTANGSSSWRINENGELVDPLYQ